MTLQARAATLEASSASQLRPAYCLLVAPLAAIGAVVALAHLPTAHAVDVVRFILALAWASAGVLVGVRRRSDRIGPIALGIASLIAGAMIFDAWAHPGLARVLAGCLPAAGLHLFMSLPDGRLGTRARRGEVLFGYAVGALVGLVGPHDASGPKL